MFQRQSAAYRDAVLPEEEWLDSTVVSNCSRRAMRDWFPHRWAEAYAMTPDWDNRWRTGGSVDDVIDEAHINAKWILEGIKRFAADRDERRSKLSRYLESV